MATLNVHFLPALTTPEALAGSTVVVIDVLRATTTIATALAAGATEVIPCFEVEEARRVASELPAGTVLLGGERGGRPIEGFDLGNSPLDYTAARVAGKTLVFTTTNGTRALQQCRQAKEVLLGAFVNLGAIVQRLLAADRVDLLCAGTDGQITAEDVLFAGAVAQQLSANAQRNGRKLALNDSATIATRFATETESAPLGRLRTLLASTGGKNLVELGMTADVHFAARESVLRVCPALDLGSWRVRGA